jgi:excisionase family DNA binding protein
MNNTTNAADENLTGDEHEQTNDTLWRKELSREMDAKLPRLFTVNEVARYLRLSKSQVYTLIQRNEIPHFRVSERRIVVSESDLKTWIQKQKASAPSQLVFMIDKMLEK